ncbi:MAG TPA: hypothetical protein VLJ42_02165 [Solirubrobacteraceae bacterium]|nr:hypothetical protein [Solirubrobacteraceae bacterium]
MLLITLIAAWLAITTLIVAVCRMAARGDRMIPATDQTPSRTIGEGLVVWDDDPPPLALYDTRLRALGVR